ncbi:MAG: hypothetical protein ABNH00_05460 [Dokdonia sp.]
MRNVAVLLTCALALLSCKNETTSTKEGTTQEAAAQPQEDVITLKGEFIYLDNAAVLNCGDKIYGVTIDDKMHELAKEVAKQQKEKVDMVPVIIHGVIGPNPVLAKNQEGWPEVVTIKEIVKVLPLNEDNAIRIESGK